jgi:putative OPT family oligopeptide transporter
MAIEQLTEEQIQTWTIEQKDRWWLENVFRGDMPQLTLRSALAGMIIGGVMSLTNLYVGMKTGWTLGVGITSVIIAFTLFKVMEKVGLAREFTLLENNCMQSIATAAGYMTSPLIASLAAYMMITNQVIPMAVTFVWIVSISLLGVLCAFPLKRRFINDEQHPFPEGRAAGVVMDALHTSDSKEGLFKGKLLILFGVASAAIELLKTGELLEKVRLGALAIPSSLEGWIFDLFNWHPQIKGVPLEELTVSIEPDHVMFAAGGLMGIRTGISLMVGAVVNYCLLAPYIIELGDIQGAADADGVVHYGFRAITTWALWGGVAMMTTASLFAFLSKPKMIWRSFAGLLGGRSSQGEDCLKHIELPMKVFLIGIPLVGALVVYLAHRFFGVGLLMGIVAVPLVFVFAIIAANATALTSITPTGALGKLTQLTYGVLAPGNMTTNVITASITGEVAGNASNLLMDIKPGYMLGGKPRHQAIGHVLGILAGAMAAVPVFYLVFLRNDPSGLVSQRFPMPAAIVWQAVAEMLTKGLSELPQSALIAAIIGAFLGILLEILKLVTGNRLPLSAVGIGLAFVIPFTTCLAMAAGSFFFWYAEVAFKNKDSIWHKTFVKCLEPVCAGVIAGGALMGISVMVFQYLILPMIQGS